ncbi:MAG: hypothetical protein ACK4GW_04965 [Pseudorhodobacter sp.]
MSAPQTNIKRQQRRHRGPLIGITAGLTFVVLLALGYFWYSGSQDTIQDAPPETSMPTTEPMADPSAAPATAAEEQVAPPAD